MNENDALWVAGGAIVGAGLFALGLWLWLVKNFHGKDGSW